MGDPRGEQERVQAPPGRAGTEALPEGFRNGQAHAHRGKVSGLNRSAKTPGFLYFKVRFPRYCRHTEKFVHYLTELEVCYGREAATAYL